MKSFMLEMWSHAREMSFSAAVTVCQKNTPNEGRSRGGFVFCKSCFFHTLEYVPDDFRGNFPGNSWISGLVNADQKS